MELIDVILSKGNLNRAYKKVVANKGASGVDGVTVEELGDYIRKNKDAIVTSIRNRTYMPKPVRRVYIPKDNGKQRPLGIPTALDRTIQQAIAQPISDIYEEIFSEYSYGFRPGKSCHDAIRQALCYLNSGYEWVVDIDIEQFFDRVNHDKLIQILPDKFFDTERPYVFWGNCLEKNRKRMIRANGDIYTCPLIIDEELKENNILRVSDLSEVENGKLYNLKEKLLSQNPKCRTCKVNPFCWNCIATIKENTENGAMDDYCSKVKAFYFNTVWGE